MNPFASAVTGLEAISSLVAGANNSLDPNPIVPQSFSGGDLFAYIDNIQVGNLESITWSTSVEVVGNYTMGSRQCRQYTTGKRVIVGSLMFAQYDRHALMEQVFKVSKNGVPATLKSIYSPSVLTARASQQTQVQAQYAATGGGGTGSSRPQVNSQLQYDNGGTAAGLSTATFAQQQNDMVAAAQKTVGSEVINYSDQLPPFDLTLVGIAATGVTASCTIFGIQTTQETGGFSMQDLGNSVGFSFVAISVNPWRLVSGTI